MTLIKLYALTQYSDSYCRFTAILYTNGQLSKPKNPSRKKQGDGKFEEVLLVFKILLFPPGKVKKGCPMGVVLKAAMGWSAYNY